MKSLIKYQTIGMNVDNFQSLLLPFFFFYFVFAFPRVVFLKDLRHCNALKFFVLELIIKYYLTALLEHIRFNKISFLIILQSKSQLCHVDTHPHKMWHCWQMLLECPCSGMRCCSTTLQRCRSLCLTPVCATAGPSCCSLALLQP